MPTTKNENCPLLIPMFTRSAAAAAAAAARKENPTPKPSSASTRTMTSESNSSKGKTKVEQNQRKGKSTSMQGLGPIIMPSTTQQNCVPPSHDDANITLTRATSGLTNRLRQTMPITKRENCPLLNPMFTRSAAAAARKENPTSKSSSASTRTMKQQSQQQSQRHHPLNVLGAIENDRQGNTTAPSSTNSTSTTGVISLPDLGLSPLAHQNELQQFGIQYKPTSSRTTKSNPDPEVHEFNALTHPVRDRRSTAVHTIFSGPEKNLWKQSKFTSFNHVQTEMAPTLANSDDNVIVSAPTGAGKTALFEMAMARLFTTVYQQSSDHHQHGSGNIDINARKIVYIAPTKALCNERQIDWSHRLLDIDPSIVCTTITGDINASSCYTEISLANLILTTPEKWDSITRRWNEHFVLLSCIKLVLIDEVHLIGETDRGGCLESIICRMKTIQRAACARMLTASEIASSSYKYTTPEALTSNMRIVAVSATLPNLGHLASFIELGEAYMFDQSYRPVPLNVYVQGCGHIGNNNFLFNKRLNNHVPSILKRFSSNRPSIVFCHSKKETEELADELTREYGNRLNSNESELMNYCTKTDNAALDRCIRKGIAFHHAGLDASDRQLVEDAFRSGLISCLASTSTLAMGVNLPCHLVVIKGTTAYRGAAEGTQDVDTGTLLQMIGRAGRPGFDTSGTAVIMTDTPSKTRYENLSQGLKAVESHLMDGNKLTEVLNIEISQGVIVSADEAADWVKRTFLYQRILSNPLFYGCNGKGDNAVQSFILDKCSASIDNLLKIRAISMHNDGTFSPDDSCHVMSRNFIEFDAMKAIVKLPHDAGPLQLLHMMSECAMIQTPVKRNEKKALNEAYKTIKYKLAGPQRKIRIQTPTQKCFVMLQAAIGRYYFSDFALRQQLSCVFDGASRILSAVEEGSRNGQVGQVARELLSSLRGGNDCGLNQINGVAQEMATQNNNNMQHLGRGCRNRGRRNQDEKDRSLTLYSKKAACRQGGSPTTTTKKQAYQPSSASTSKSHRNCMQAHQSSNKGRTHQDEKENCLVNSKAKPECEPRKEVKATGRQGAKPASQPSLGSVTNQQDSYEAYTDTNIDFLAQVCNDVTCESPFEDSSLLSICEGNADTANIFDPSFLTYHNSGCHSCGGINWSQFEEDELQDDPATAVNDTEPRVQNKFNPDEISAAREKCKSYIKEVMERADATDMEISSVLDLVDSIEYGSKVLILLMLCPTSKSTGWVQISLAHDGVNNPPDFDLNSCCSVRVFNTLYGPLIEEGWLVHVFNIRFNCKLMIDQSGCQPCSREEGAVTADLIDRIGHFTKEYLNVEIKLVSQAGRSTNVSKYCVAKLQHVNVVLRNGYHLSLLGYMNMRCFISFEHQVRMITKDVRQISEGIEEPNFLATAVGAKSILVAADDPTRGMDLEQLEAVWKAASYRRALINAAGGTKGIEEALGIKIADVTETTLRLFAGLRGVANAMKMLGVESLADVDIDVLNEKLFTVSKWWKLYQVLVAFKSMHGHILVPQAYKENPALGSWVNTQRTQYALMMEGKHSQLTVERVRLLNDLVFVWSARDEIWDNNLRALAAYRKENEGSTQVPYQHKTEDGLALGEWVSNQRRLKNVKSDDDISKERVRLLNDLGFVWNAQEAQWLEYYKALQQFEEEFGHTLVPQRYVVNRLKLGVWVSYQRSEWKRKQNSKEDSCLTDERERLLNNLGFVWNVLEAQWLENYEALAEYKIDHNGNVCVPRRYVVNGLKLGVWVSHQRVEWKRKQNGKVDSWLTVERVRLLDALGFAWKLRG